MPSNRLQKTPPKGNPKRVCSAIPERYEAISEALLDTIYDVSSPEESSQNILKSLRESDS
jgi:hemoglobin-like flavoprotein